MKRLLLSALALLPALILANCSTHFHHDWKKAATSIETTSPGSVSGAWQGTWKSEATGHHGTLKAVVSALNANDGIYAFHYRATWRRILSATFQSEHTVQVRGKDFILTGQHDLGNLFGGIYHYHGTATPTMLECRYRSNLDHGIFQLQRP